MHSEGSFTALYDSCVLYPAPLRDLLVRLGGANLFRARWTDKIHDEWIRNVLADRPDLSRERLDRARCLMNDHILDCLITNYEDLEETIELHDDHFRHVVAAAIYGRADVIVTFNLKDFPDSVLARYSIEAQHPDVFVGNLLSLYEADVCDIVRRQRADLKKPPQTVEELLSTLKTQGSKDTVSRLQALTEQL